MSRYILSIRTLMIVISIIAFNIAAIRYASDQLIVLAPIGLFVQVGLAALFLTRGRTRAFWAGFVFCGTLSILSLLPPLNYPPIGYLQPMGPASFNYVTQVEGSLAWQFWFTYVQLSMRNLGVRNQGADDQCLMAALYLLPMLVLAVTGGMLTTSLTWYAKRIFMRNADMTPIQREQVDFSRRADPK